MGTIGDQQLVALSGTGTIQDRLRASLTSSPSAGTMDDLGGSLGSSAVTLNIADQYWRVGANFLSLDTSLYFNHSPNSFAGTMPGGLSLNASTGLITGSPTTAGTYNVTVTATNAGSVVDTRSFVVYIREWWEDSSNAADIASHAYHPGSVTTTGSDIDSFVDLIGSTDLAYSASVATGSPSKATLSGSDAVFVATGGDGDSAYFNTWTSSLGSSKAAGFCWGFSWDGVKVDTIGTPATIGTLSSYATSNLRFDVDDVNDEFDFRVFNAAGTTEATTGVSFAGSGDLYGYVFIDGSKYYSAVNGRLNVYNSSAAMASLLSGSFSDTHISVGRYPRSSTGVRTGSDGAGKGWAFWNDADSPTIEEVSKVTGGLTGAKASGLSSRPAIVCYSMGNSIKGGWSPGNATQKRSIAAADGFSLISTLTAGVYTEDDIYDVIDHDLLNLTNNTSNLLGDAPGGANHYTGRASPTIYMLERLTELSNVRVVHAEVTENGACWHPDTADFITRSYWFSDSDVTNSSSQTCLYDAALPHFLQCDNIVKATPELDQDHIFRMVYVGGLSAQDARQGQISLSEFETGLRAFLTRVNADLAPDLIILDQCSVDRAYSPDYSLFEAWHAVELDVIAEFANVTRGCPLMLEEGVALTGNSDNEWTAGADYVSTDDVHMEALHHEYQGRWDAKNTVWPAVQAKWQTV